MDPSLDLLNLNVDHDRQGQTAHNGTIKSRTVELREVM